MYEGTGFICQLYCFHSFPAPVGDPVLIDIRPFAVAFFCYHKNILFLVLDSDHSYHDVGFLVGKPYSSYA